MSIAAEHAAIKAPCTYQDWLACFDRMKNASDADAEVFDAACMGVFTGSEQTKIALQRQLVETVNAFLEKRVKRFLRSLNENIAFNELPQTELLFKRLKRDVERSLFFTKLTFLPQSYRAELEASVKEQMSGFWDNTVSFLRKQSLEVCNAELEDVLFLVKRIRLFEA